MKKRKRSICKNSVKQNIYHGAISSLFVLLAACGSATVEQRDKSASYISNSLDAEPAPNCIRKGAKIYLRWGEIRNGTSMYPTDSTTYSGWQLSPVGVFDSIYSPKPAILRTVQISRRVPNAIFCALFDSTKRALLQVQVLNYPGKVQRFLEYADSTQQVYFRGMWNPEFKNAGNKGVNAVYDSLEVMRKSLAEK